MQLSCTKCGVTVSSLYLKQHMDQLYGIFLPQTRGFNEIGGVPITYVVSFPRVLQLVRYPVPGFPAVVHSTGQLQEHFMYQHFLLQVAVFQEVSEPLTCCGL